jgi:transcriptional regulator with XRE-family HTH domain
MNIGKTISTLRKKQGLNQTAFAKRCQITQTALSQIETGASRPSQKNIERIALELKTPLELLYLLSIYEDDIPDEKKETYRMLYSTLKSVAIDMLTTDDGR